MLLELLRMLMIVVGFDSITIECLLFTAYVVMVFRGLHCCAFIGSCVVLGVVYSICGFGVLRFCV